MRSYALLPQRTTSRKFQATVQEGGTGRKLAVSPNAGTRAGSVGTLREMQFTGQGPGQGRAAQENSRRLHGAPSAVAANTDHHRRPAVREEPLQSIRTAKTRITETTCRQGCGARAPTPRWSGSARTQMPWEATWLATACKTKHACSTGSHSRTAWYLARRVEKIYDHTKTYPWVFITALL